jgi:hypothetical protein
MKRRPLTASALPGVLPRSFLLPPAHGGPAAQWRQGRAAAPMLRYMTAEPIQPAASPGRNPAAIRDALPAGERAEFARAYETALEEARRTWSLQR